MEKLGLTVTILDGDDNYTPRTGLEQSDFSFVLASDSVTPVSFTGFEESGEGNYNFWGFDVSSGNVYKVVKVKINGVLQPAYGNITVYADNDQPTSKSYNDTTYGITDNGNYWSGTNEFNISPYLDDDSNEFTTNTPQFEQSLIWKGFADSKYGKLNNSNTWTGATNQFEAGLFHDVVYFEDTATGQDFEMEPLCNLYLGIDQPANGTLVWKKWIIDNYGTGGTGTGIPINTNRIIVDSKASTNITGKIYSSILTAITYASTQTPSSSSRWEIFIMPHHSNGYAENITIPRYVDLIGFGSVVITGYLRTTQDTGAQTWTGYDARIENLVFNTINLDIKLTQLKIKNCQFRANGSSGEVNFIIDGSEILDSGLYVQNDVNIEINNTTKINRVKGVYGNISISWLSTDEIYTYNFIIGSQWEF